MIAAKGDTRLRRRVKRHFIKYHTGARSRLKDGTWLRTLLYEHGAAEVLPDYST